MKYQPNRNYKSSDEYMTPIYLCKQIIDYFKPNGLILEPCKGTGNFLKACPKMIYCEQKENKPFEKFNKKVDWVITNPPWSKFKFFLEKSFSVSNYHVVFLVTINHIFTKARVKLARNYNFGLKDILYIDTPKEFPQTGFQLGVIHWQKDYKGLVNIKKL
ncbi:hypothetical protein DRN73_08195 [Candidatus Pacearchaeota archaeon]|nr:MAG: hypothetical protein DRN73_08195 [Candidatus Pacearchaeota archaeon]